MAEGESTYENVLQTGYDVIHQEWPVEGLGVVLQQALHNLGNEASRQERGCTCQEMCGLVYRTNAVRYAVCKEAAKKITTHPLRQFPRLIRTKKDEYNQ